MARNAFADFASDRVEDQPTATARLAEISQLVAMGNNIHDAKTRLSKLLEGVRRGEPFIIAKAGHPIARVVPVECPDVGEGRRLGFLEGEVDVPDDFDQMGDSEIGEAFGLDG